MSIHATYLRDIGSEVRQQAEQSAAEARANRTDAFLQGEAAARYGVVSLMQQQAVAFGLPMDDLGLDGLDADRDLL